MSLHTNSDVNEFAILDQADAASAFRHMTFPAYQHLLDFDSSRPAPLAIAVRNEADSTGLALAYPAADNAADLLSVFVESGARGQGLGTELVRRIESVCMTRGVKKLTATYMTGQPGTEAVERIFARTGWSEPHTRMLVVRCSLDSIKSAPWMKQYRLPEGYEILSWIDVSAQERREIMESHKAEAWIAADLVPFDFEQDIEPITSIALRVRGRILGWCLNHVIGDVLRYTCSFVRRDLQRLGRILLLYNEAVARMPRARLSVGSWTVPVWHAGMANFARKHMQPYSIFFGETRGVEKSIATGALQ